MRVDVRFNCPLANGVHARPASLLAETARGFESQVTIGREGGVSVDARSVLSVVGLDLRMGEACLIVVDGPDASPAAGALRSLVEVTWAASDEVVVSVGSAAAPKELPIGLRGLNVRHVIGRGVSGGIGRGVVVHVQGLSLPPALRAAKARDPGSELSAVRRALAAVGEDLRQRASAAGRCLEGELLAAHAGMAEDPALRAEVERAINAGATAPQAVLAATESLAAKLSAAESQYVRDRALDVQDVGSQILERLTGGHSGEITLKDDSIVVAEVLTPSRLMAMTGQGGKLRGLVLGAVGATSHIVILARSLGIPTVVGVQGPSRTFRAGESLIVEGACGFAVASGDAAVTRYFERRERAATRRRALIEPIARKPGATADGVRVEVGINATSPAEVAAAIAAGAEGVGLLRTEFLFLDRETPPTEEEQFKAYAAVVEAAAGRPVIIRTLDIGGDKPAPYLRIPREDNPFLGWRGIRLYPSHADLIGSQLRAIARAAALGPVKVMAPMVATAAEAAWFKAQVRAVHPTIPVGVMIEVPSAALVMDQICTEVDFVSLGTNDLSQYWMAADRGNPAVAALCNPLEPSFLRLLRTIIAGAKQHGTWVGVCGEMAGRARHLPLMVGLGVDEISVVPGEMPGLKSLLAGLDSGECRALVQEAANCRTPEEVSAVLARSERARHAASPILDPAAITVASDAATKEEAIREAVDALYVIGRTEQPAQVEEAVWAREKTYSTGLGYSFAIPHCKTDAVLAPTLAVVRLAQPIDWGSTDGQPVITVILLAVPTSEAAGAHMKVFATLARRLMHEEFRSRLGSAVTADAIYACLRGELGLV